jgi:glutaredoxin 3
MHFKKYHEINLYTSPESKLCELAKVYFRSAGHDFLEFDISKNETAKKKMVEISDQQLTPVVEIDGRVVVGYQQDMYDHILDEGDQRNERDNDDEKRKKEESDAD